MLGVALHGKMVRRHDQSLVRESEDTNIFITFGFVLFFQKNEESEEDECGWGVKQREVSTVRTMCVCTDAFLQSYNPKHLLGHNKTCFFSSPAFLTIVRGSAAALKKIILHGLLWKRVKSMESVSRRDVLWLRLCEIQIADPSYELDSLWQDCEVIAMPSASTTFANLSLECLSWLSASELFLHEIPT